MPAHALSRPSSSISHGFKSLAMILAAVSLTGCHVVPDNPHAKLDFNMEQPLRLSVEKPIIVRVETGLPYKGTYISPELVELVKVNVTPADYVVAIFGDPDSRRILNDKSEIWVWRYVPLTENAPMVSVLKAAAGTKPTAAHVTVFVRVRNGIVVEKFRG